MLTILVLFGCCLIPCFQALFLRAIESAVEKRDIMYSALPAEEEDYAQPTAPAYDDEVSLHLFDSTLFNEWTSQGKSTQKTCPGDSNIK